MPRLNSLRREGHRYGLFLTLLLIGLCACEADGGRENEAAGQRSVPDKKKSTDPNPIRHELKVRWIDINASYVITINGFPALQEYVQARSVDNEFDVQLNTGLVGKGNEAEIRLEPLLTRSRKSLSIGTTELEAQVLGPERSPIRGAKITESEVDSAYEAWSERAREQWESYRSTVDRGALDSIRAWAERNPLTVSTTFDNEAGPDFSRIFEEAPKLEDTPATRKRLKDYAMRLRDLMARKDTSALFEEFRFYYAQQYKITGYDGSVEEDRASLRENVVMDNPELSFGREEIELRQWSKGRVWEFYREGADAFFQSGNTIREVYVAEIEGELKVVR